MAMRWADEDDVALSAFHSFCARAATGRFPDLKHRYEVRNLLITITSRKANEYLRYHARKRRGGQRFAVISFSPRPEDPIIATD
jgi:hypothetical protein